VNLSNSATEQKHEYVRCEQVAQLSQRPRCRVGQFWPKVEDDVLGLSSITET